MITTLTMMAALVAAFFWIIFLQWKLTRTTKRLSKVDQRLRSARLTLTATKEANEVLTVETEFLKGVLFDVARGEAHVWIEGDELRAARKSAGNTSVH